MSEPKLRVLLVEQDRTIIDTLRAGLESMGAELIVPATATELTAAIERGKLDGAILAWEDNRFAGEGVAQRLRQSPSNALVPIVMLTEATDTASIGRASRAGADYYLVKPFVTRAMYRVLHAAYTGMIRERRRYRRVEVDVPVACTWENQRAEGTIKNLSTGGALVRAKELPQVERPVSVVFRIPNEEHAVELKAEVVRHTPAQEFAVRFTGVPQSVVTRLDVALEALALGAPNTPKKN